MDEYQKLPPEDFMYDKVDLNFLIELSMLSHFVNLANQRIQANKKNHIQCEVFLVLKTLIDNHLPDLTKKVVSTEQSQKDLDGIFRKNRDMMEKAVKKEIQKQGQEFLNHQPETEKYEEAKEKARAAGLII